VGYLLPMIGPRIEIRLRELGMSQAELARRAGVPQTTINGLIRGNSRTTPHLIRIAQALATTPAYLTGETDNLNSEMDNYQISSQEKNLIECIRNCPPGIKRSIFKIIAYMK
jgi:transcriptional regulator with XRE-family HTH domain